MMQRVYTGVGSRKTPDAICSAMRRAAARLASSHWLRSGGAQGADRAFEEGAREGGGRAVIYLPWAATHSRLHEDSDRFHYVVGASDRAHEIAQRFHPAWDRCSPAARLLHARNVYQVLGKTLDRPTGCVVCWTQDGADLGGTAMAIKVARHAGIPICNVGSPAFQGRSIDWIVSEVCKFVADR